jgi:unsaturated chondroitin disaccharide hydrolase
MINIIHSIQASNRKPKLQTCWFLSGEKIWSIEKEFDKIQGSPVFTVKGKYTSRGWTEWTQGFQYGSAILQCDDTDETPLNLRDDILKAEKEC